MSLLMLSGPPAAAGDAGPPPALRASVTLVGADPAKASVREVVGELLDREGVVVSWASQASFRPQDLLEPAQDRGPAAVAVWIDLAALGEAHLYFRDVSSQWFVIRTLPLPGGRGLDEIAKEEIGHIVASAVVALGTGSGKALTRSEARAVLQAPGGQSPTAPPAATRASLPRFALGAWAAAQLFAPQKATAEFLGLSLVVAPGPRWGQGTGGLGAWLDAGYQIAGAYRDNAVGVDIHTVALRAGLLWDIQRLQVVRFRVGLGGGVDHVSYRPQGDSATVDIAAEGRFLVPHVCLWGGVEVRAAEHLALTLRALGDLALARVHYDVGSRDGQRAEVLAPYALRPGLSVGAAFVY